MRQNGERGVSVAADPVSGRLSLAPPILFYGRQVCYGKYGPILLLLAAVVILLSKSFALCLLGRCWSQKRYVKYIQRPFAHPTDESYYMSGLSWPLQRRLQSNDGLPAETAVNANGWADDKNNNPFSLTFFGSYDLSVNSVDQDALQSEGLVGAAPPPQRMAGGRVTTFLRDASSGSSVRLPSDPALAQALLSASVPDGEVAYKDGGVIRLLLLSRPSVLPGVRLALVRVELESRGKRPGRRVLRLSGLHLDEIPVLSLQGVARPRALQPDKAELEDETNITLASVDVCQMVASLQLRSRVAGTSSRGITTRPLETSGTRWGLDDADFGLGGSWSSRRLLEGDVDEASGGLEVGRVQENSGYDADEANEEDVWGTLASPNCGVFIRLRGREVNLSELTTGVVSFVILFVLKSLTEMRAFFAQVRHAEWPGSPLKTSYASLALHVCVDCFDIVLLLGQAASSNFMASAFVLLAVLKLLFVSAVQLRFLVVVVRARMIADSATANINDNTAQIAARLSRFVKIHAALTALLLIGALEGINFWPGCLAALYLFWIPQIALDASAGNRRSLSIEYLLLMSLSRLVLPLYLWGNPHSVFDGRILRQPPGAPSLALCCCLVGLVAAQVFVVLAQQKFGPRFFIPRWCLAPPYDYYRSLPPTLVGSSVPPSQPLECVICMSELDASKRFQRVAVTPCNHVFHDSCLLRWLEVKHECPTCRGALPPFL